MLQRFSNSIKGIKGYDIAWSIGYNPADGKWYWGSDRADRLSQTKQGTMAVMIFIDEAGNLRFSMDDVLDFINLHHPNNGITQLDLLEGFLHYKNYKSNVPILPYSDTLDMSMFDFNKKRLP